MKIIKLIIPIIIFLLAFKNDKEDFGKAKKTKDHVKLSNEGLYIIPPQGFNQDISYIGFSSGESQMVVFIENTSTIEKTINNLQTHECIDWKSKTTKLSDISYYYFEKSNETEPQKAKLVLVRKEGKAFKISLSSNNREKFEKMKKSLYTLVWE